MKRFLLQFGEISTCKFFKDWRNCTWPWGECNIDVMAYNYLLLTYLSTTWLNWFGPTNLSAHFSSFICYLNSSFDKVSQHAVLTTCSSTFRSGTMY